MFKPRYDLAAVRNMDQTRLVAEIAELKGKLNAMNGRDMRGPEAAAHEDLGWLYLALSLRNPNKQSYWDAMNAFDYVTSLRYQDEDPLGWARAHTSLGTARFAFAQWRDDPNWMIKAVHSHRSALAVYSRAETPEPWSNVQLGLAHAMDALSQREQTEKRHEETVWHYRAALTEILPGRRPALWADTKERFARALARHALLRKDAALMNEARLHMLAAGLAKRKLGDEKGFKDAQAEMARMNAAMKTMER